MFIGWDITSLVLAIFALVTPSRGPVVRLDDAVGYRLLRLLFGGH